MVGPGADACPPTALMPQQRSQFSVLPLARSPMRAVCGNSHETAHLNGLAEAVGTSNAHHGAVVICAGFAGALAADDREASQPDGLSVRVLPQADPALATRLGHARNAVIVQRLAARIALDHLSRMRCERLGSSGATTVNTPRYV